MQLLTVAIIQARMSSSRLPGKVLLDIGGLPMLGRVVDRARRAKRVDQVVVATTIDPADDEVAKYCSQQGYAYYRGSQQDVLDRFYQTALAYHASVIVRLTADCPIIDPDVIDETVSAFLGYRTNLLSEDPSSVTGNSGLTRREGKSTINSNQSEIPYDFATNRLPPPWHRTYPIGLDVEVCTFKALERAWREADQPHQREHVMPYLYEQEGRFKVLVVNHEPDYGNLRWTVDTPDDLELIRQIYDRFNGRDDFTFLEVLSLFEREPELSNINSQVRHKDYREAERTENA